METREANIRDIKNLELIYIYTIDSFFKDGSNKYIGIKVIYDNGKVFNIEYDDRFFEKFIKKLINEYNNEKEKGNIILLGNLSKKMMNDLSFYVLNNKKEEDLIENEIPMFRVYNKNILRYKSILFQMLELILRYNLNYDNITIKSLYGHGKKYMIECNIDNKSVNFPIILYSEDDCLNFEINRILNINTDAKGKIKFVKGKLICDFTDNNFNGSIIYNPIENKSEKRIYSDNELLFFDESNNYITKNEKEMIELCLNFLSFKMPSNIIKIDSKSYILESCNSLSNDDCILEESESYFVSFEDDYTIISRINVNGIMKYNNQFNMILDKELEEHIFKKIKIDNKEYIIHEKRFNDGKDYFSYKIYEVTYNKNNVFEPVKEILYENEYSIDEIVLKIRGGI